MEVLRNLGDAPCVGHALVALVVILLIALVGRLLARALRQPVVIGEVVVGLLSGPAVIALFGRGALNVLLPGSVLDVVRLVAQAGLVLFLVGLAHKLGVESAARRGGSLWVVAGALVPPLVAGLLLAGLVLLTGDDSARGSAPLPAFLLMVAVSMAITAVPVMARILADRGMTRSRAGQTALGAAVVVDAVGWLLLSLAVSLGKGSPEGMLHSVRALGLGVLCALGLRYGLRTRVARSACARLPRTTAVLLGAVALVVAIAMDRLGMTPILGAALVGFAIPAGEGMPWEDAVATVSRAGAILAPAFFVVTGITVLTGSFTDTSWQLIVAALVLGCLGKGLGSYLGARRGGRTPATARKVAVLMNTRGLTELVALQAGLSAGILTGPLALALIVMALTTTAMTGPLLTLLARGEHRPAGARLVAARGAVSGGREFHRGEH
ncbi:sodium:proton exchanger [Streptomyces sp. CB01201]|uniref:cation:proton antiporter n=1 Tax=Streptomyces sp. CB01201 TaxID=2020324 RepID=UPI000C27381E|nr:cation:proton antiporter [Streptomyces sp. CB01201]PJN03098.1 sodium:proton exchanger [Streptomyces sp. CB01201]